MILFWMAYTLLYSTVFWAHLDAPGASYIRSTSARVGLPAIDVSHILVSAGFPLANLAVTPTADDSIVFSEIPSPTATPTPTSTPIAIPNTIIFPASPLPTATLPHQALPQCYDGLHDSSSPLDSRPPTRTATGTTTALIASPGLFVRYLLISLALASALANNLARTPTLGYALVCIPGLVCVSWVLVAVRRASFKATAPRARIASQCSHPCGANEFSTRPGTREIDNLEDLVTATSSPNDASSTPPASPLSTTTLKRLATTGPVLSKTGRMIARKQRNRSRRHAPAKANTIPTILRNAPSPRNNRDPRNGPPPTTAEADTRVWSVDGSPTVEYAPPVRRSKKRAPLVGDGLDILD